MTTTNNSFQTRRSDVVDQHNTSDPYRWLENSESDEVREWIGHQKTLTTTTLENCDGIQQFKEQLTAFDQYDKFCTPLCVVGTFFQLRKNTGEKQFSVYRMTSASGENISLLVSGNELLSGSETNPDDEIAINAFEISDNGEMIAYAVSRNGSDWIEIKIRNVNSLEDYPETITNARFTEITWFGNDGFFYCKYPSSVRGIGDIETEVAKNQMLYYHKMGTDGDDDILIYHDPENEDYLFETIVTGDQKTLIIKVVNGCNPNNKVFL
ncbi:MAG: hypothetical protein JKX76_01540 [Colwellia sp.]|nr:hypothetical protein [Colwellia sp.]